MGIAPIELIETLTARGDTLAGLERLLQLSPGYLSKVRRGRVTPSAQLVALLRVLVQHPEVRPTLEASVNERAAPVPAPPSPRSSTFVAELMTAWRASAVRFHAVDDGLLEQLGVEGPPGLEPSLRFLLHPDDRHALADARTLGALVNMASSRACVCTPADGADSIVFVFPLEPLHHLFERGSLTALDAALYFALQHDEDAELRLRAVAVAHNLPRVDLQREFEIAYGGAAPLPEKEWLLRSTFDLDVARMRLARLP